jgi:uridine kinase
MNIVEAFTKLNNKLIILISGLSGSGKTMVAQNIAKDFNIGLIDLESYCDKDFHKKVKVSNNLTITDWDDIDSYNWIKFNKEVDIDKDKGVVICGYMFPRDKLTIEPDFHIHIKMSKQKIMEYRHEYVKKHKNECNEIFSILDTSDELLLINNVVYPHYTKYLELSNIQKFLNGNNLSREQMYDQTFEYLIGSIKNKIDKYNENLIKRKKRQNVIDDDNYFEGERRHYDTEYIADQIAEELE